MKELNIEQKAKAYDEIIKKANTMHSENCEACKACLEELIPELAESEDERIRKALITYFSDEDESYDGIPYPSILAWLEKQSKASKVEQAMREVEEKAKAFTEAHKGETSEEILAQMRGEQKPWSEEDEMFVHGLIRGLTAKRDIHGHTTFSSDGIDITETINWLKSLKDRVQPKQEWKQENTHDLTDFENVMMHIGDSFFGQYAGLDPNNTIAIKEQANILLGLVPKQEWSEEDEKDYELVESAEDVDAQINSQNEAIKNLNSALNSMEHNGHLPKMMTAAESLGISEEEYAKIEDEFFKEQEEPVRGDFEMALAEMIDKAQKCVVEPWVVAAQWKDELVKLAKECKAMQEHPKDCMYLKDNYTDEDRKILCEGCEEDCKYNKKEDPVSEDLEKELPKVWDRETLDEYAYQVAYDLSNDWMKETPTWNDVETACKLGAEWKEKHMIELGMSVSNKAQKGE